MSGRYLTAARLRDLDAGLLGRDELILRHVSDLRFMSGAQLTRLGFGDHDDPVVAARAARRTLLRLVRLGALQRLPRAVGGARSGSAGFVYHLGPAGQVLAMTRGWQPERRRRRSLVPGTLFVDHALQVSELHVRLIESDRAELLELLELAAEPACWRSYGGLASQLCKLKPDSFVRLGAGDYEDSYFIEIDRGTEGSRALEGQLQRYIAYARSGQEQAAHQVFPKVLWTTNTARRQGVLQDCVQRLPRAERGLFAVVPFEAALDFLAAGEGHPPASEKPQPRSQQERRMETTVPNRNDRRAS